MQHESITLEVPSVNEPQKNMQKLTYTIPEVSQILNISVSQVYKLANQKIIPTIRLGNRILVSIKRLQEFIDQ